MPQRGEPRTTYQTTSHPRIANWFRPKKHRKCQYKRPKGPTWLEIYTCKMQYLNWIELKWRDKLIFESSPTYLVSVSQRKQRHVDTAPLVGLVSTTCISQCSPCVAKLKLVYLEPTGHTTSSSPNERNQSCQPWASLHCQERIVELTLVHGRSTYPPPNVPPLRKNRPYDQGLSTCCPFPLLIACGVGERGGAASYQIYGPFTDSERVTYGGVPQWNHMTIRNKSCEVGNSGYTPIESTT